MNEKDLSDLKTPKNSTELFDILHLLENFCYLKWNAVLFGKPLDVNPKRTWG